ncbi:hypothetical protein CRG98_026462 [Punica granatum]|uniref:Uncharacterized protein n=1 Tax=Punica granatum TaxID=22663 RepID=A0A2I0JA84_PUNGR|nr:hypothetical protein CRG98_026462 [Punica granatum]
MDDGEGHDLAVYQKGLSYFSSRGRWRPPWVPATSVEGSESLMAVPTPNRPKTSDLESPVDSGLGPPIGDLNPSTEIIVVACRYRRPQWRGQGRRLASLTPN